MTAQGRLQAQPLPLSRHQTLREGWRAAEAPLPLSVGLYRGTRKALATPPQSGQHLKSSCFDMMLCYLECLFFSLPLVKCEVLAFFLLLQEKKSVQRARYVRNWQSSTDSLRLSCPSIHKGQVVTDQREQHDIQVFGHNPNLCGQHCFFF